jgi:hypothetical protein
MNRELKKISGSGYCYMDAVLTSLELDYGDKSYSMQSLMNEIVMELLQNKTTYTHYHPGSDPDHLINSAIQYILQKSYTDDVVDIIVMATMKVLHLKITIFQKGPNGNVIEIDLGPETTSSEKHIFLQYTHDTEYAASNHYSSVVLKKKKLSTMLFDLLSDDECDSQTRNSTTSTPTPTSSSFDLFTPSSNSIDTLSDVSNNIDLESDTANSQEDFPNSQNLPQMPHIGRGRKVDMRLFAYATVEKADTCPHNIDGCKIYHIRCTVENHNTKVRDGRYFPMAKSNTKSATFDKIGRCKGHMECSNKDCPFIQTSGKPNTHQFSLYDKGKFCFVCESPAVNKPCGVLKYTRFNQIDGLLKIYHYGNHTCTPKPNRRISKPIIEAALGKHPDLGAKHLGRKIIGEYILEHRFEEANEAANHLSDTRQIKQMKQAGKFYSREERMNMNTVIELKKELDAHLGRFYIYDINDYRCNNKPSHVFKSSPLAAEMMLGMDKDNPNANELQSEVCYFDGMHKRVHGYKTLTLWLYNIICRKLMRLATMEVVSEKEPYIVIFFQLINEMLAELKEVPGYKFNPKYIMTDEAGAIINAINAMFGKRPGGEDIVKTCQMHLKKNAVEKSRKLKNEEQGPFMEIIHQMCEVATISRYDELKEEMNELVTNDEVMRWFEWWDVRRYHIFPPFRGYSLPSMNLAEPGQSGMKPQKPMMLVDACAEDVAYMKLQDAEYSRFIQGNGMSSGQGPTILKRRNREERDVGFRVKEYARQLCSQQMPTQEHTEMDHRAADFRPTSASSHKPPRNFSTKNPWEMKKKERKERNSKPKSKRIAEDVGNEDVGNEHVTEATEGFDEDLTEATPQIDQVLTEDDYEFPHMNEDEDSDFPDIIPDTDVEDYQVPLMKRLSSRTKKANTKSDYIYLQKGGRTTLAETHTGRGRGETKRSRGRGARRGTKQSTPAPQGTGAPTTSTQAAIGRGTRGRGARGTPAPQGTGAPSTSTPAAIGRGTRGRGARGTPAPQGRGAPSTSTPAATVIGRGRGARGARGTQHSTPPQGRGGSTSTQQSTPATTPTMLQAQSSENPPMIVMHNAKISKCHGCHFAILNQHIVPPANLVFKMMAIRSWKDTITKQWRFQTHASNVYFHLRMKCLRLFRPTIDFEDIRITNDVRRELTDQNIQHLEQKELWQFVK